MKRSWVDLHGRKVLSILSVPWLETAGLKRYLALETGYRGPVPEKS